MSDSFYRDSAERRLQQLTASRAAELADLEAHKLNSDHDAAAECIQRIADLDAAKQNLTELYSRYVSANTPAAPREISPEERLARPISHMDWSDVVEMTRGSKYARNIKPDDPALLAGWQEVRSRRARGE
jgi:hypothetical protein